MAVISFAPLFFDQKESNDGNKKVRVERKLATLQKGNIHNKNFVHEETAQLEDRSLKRPNTCATNSLCKVRNEAHTCSISSVQVHSFVHASTCRFRSPYVCVCGYANNVFFFIS